MSKKNKNSYFFTWENSEGEKCNLLFLATEAMQILKNKSLKVFLTEK
jgi:hypothetical protein